MMDSFKRRNKALEHALTHAEIVNEYESELKDLKRDNERLRAYNDELHSKVENVKYFLKIRMFSLKNSLKKEPDRIKQAQLALCREVQGELR